MKTDPLRLLAGGLAALVFTTAALGYTYITNATTGLPVKWPEGTVSLRIMLGTTPVLIDGSNYSTSAKGAAETWNAVLGSMQFQTTIAAGAPTDHNHINELAFAADIFGQPFDKDPTKVKTILAITTTWVLGNQRTEGDIIFNTAWTWDSYPGDRRPGIVDIHRVALHEMGHLLGLDHPDEAGQTVSAIMNSHVSNLDTLAMDDITGAQNLYGPPGAPVNDNFASATVITLTNNAATLAGFNTLATKETGEPSHVGSNRSTSFVYNGGHSVWWKWTAPATGSVMLDTRGSYFDTTLGVYTGSTLSSLVEVAFSDDITDGKVQASSLTFNATSGTVYYFAVDGFNNNDGNGADSGGITLNLAVTVTNATAPTITAQPVSVTTTAGNNVSFSVTATAGTSTITYQWQFNGTAISGASSSSLSLSSVTSANAGTYTVVVTATGVSVTSDSASLTVNAPMVVTPPPAPPPSSGGGGGGAPSLWFLLSLGTAGLARLFRRR